MNWYEMAVVLETISVKAQTEEQAEEMYARWNGCGEENTCPNHPEIEVSDSDWECGCATTDQEVYHDTTYAGSVREL